MDEKDSNAKAFEQIMQEIEEEKSRNSNWKSLVMSKPATDMGGKPHPKIKITYRDGSEEQGIDDQSKEQE